MSQQASQSAVDPFAKSRATLLYFNSHQVRGRLNPGKLAAQSLDVSSVHPSLATHIEDQGN